MSGYVSFEGSVEPVLLGKATHTMIRVPEAAYKALKARGAIRVEGEINAHPVNLALRRTPGSDGWCLWAGKTLLDRAGIAPGETLEVRLRTAAEDLVDTPDDVILALRQSEALNAWHALTPGKRRGLLYQVNGAKRAATRAKRVAKLVDEVRA